MRKFFALALAVAMVLSLASVAFAANLTATVDLAGPYRYHADSNVMRDPAYGEKKDVNRYGEGTYYLLQIKDEGAADYAAISAYKEVEKLKVKAEFEMGKDLVESVSIVKKYVDTTATWDHDNNSGTDKVLYAIAAPADAAYLGGHNPKGALNNAKAGYYYFVEIKVAKKETTADADIVGTLEFNRKADSDVISTSRTGAGAAVKGIGKIDDDEHDISFNVFYADAYTKYGSATDFTVEDEADLKYDTDYALKFDCDDEVDLNFGDSQNSGTNEGVFTVDASGQGKVYLRYNTKPVDAIVDANPGVKMFFLNFNNVKFNRTGEFVYDMDDIAAAYKVVDGQLVEIKGLELDSDSATFHTRVLESYVFADAELVNPAPAAVEAPAASEVTNPTTGAAA